ncbi:hypothetical protein J6590_035990 [Homalodisca vitripennis]|nr:hypothetical protein J6590_035990 [Homalodisca vitripennis]
MYQAKALCEDKISSMGAEEWSVKCKHVEKIERDYAAAEPQIDNIIESLIISVGSDTDSSDNDPEEEDNLSVDPPYSLDFALSDYHMFLHMKRDLGGQRFETDGEVITAKESWLHS